MRYAHQFISHWRYHGLALSIEKTAQLLESLAYFSARCSGGLVWQIDILMANCSFELLRHIVTLRHVTKPTVSHLVGLVINAIFNAPQLTQPTMLLHMLIAYISRCSGFNICIYCQQLGSIKCYVLYQTLCLAACLHTNITILVRFWLGHSEHDAVFLSDFTWFTLSSAASMVYIVGIRSRNTMAACQCF